jgi:hypothetical protein
VVQYQEQQEVAGMEILGILGGDAAGGKPSQEYCVDWANSAGFPPERLLIDPDFTQLFQAMAPGGASGNAIPWDGILNGEGMVYTYSSALSAESPFNVVEGLLNSE